MAVEAKRGCGYRKVGGLYLVGSGDGVACDRLPLALTVCPCCSAGIKQKRGWTWVDVHALVGGTHAACGDVFPCPLCTATAQMGKTGLLWIGAQFYPTPEDFMKESADLGISRRIGAVPKGFKVGSTWVMLAHPKAMACADCHGAGLNRCPDCDEAKRLAYSEATTPGFIHPTCDKHRDRVTDSEPCVSCKGAGKMAGIFRVFRPHAIEKIITESQSQDPVFMEKEITARGFTAVVVPDNDLDHRGTVYDADAENGDAENGAVGK